jgi:hypothetical protein
VFRSKRLSWAESLVRVRKDINKSIEGVGEIIWRKEAIWKT